jgi:hypothetical protein
MKRKTLVGAALLLYGLSVMGPADAVRRRDKTTEDTGAPPDAPFQESKIPPPSYPIEGDLIEFTLTGRTSNRFYIDGSSLSIGPDEVIRFVLVVRTPAQVSNVSFSGVRCDTKEWKDYAFAGPDRVWRIDEQARWRLIEQRVLNNYQETLFKEFFCFGGIMTGGPAGSAKSIVRNLKYPREPDPHVPRKY